MKLDFKQIEVELSEIKEIVGRLDYWYNLIDENIYQKIRLEFGLKENYIRLNSQINYRLQELRTNIGLFENSEKTLTSIFIPEDIYNKYFKEFESNPKYSMWFLKENSKIHFNFLYSSKGIGEAIERKDVNHLKVFLKDLIDFEEQAENYRADYKINIYYLEENTSYDGQAELHYRFGKVIEYLRLKNGYYENHPIKNIHKSNNQTEEVFAKHFLFKQCIAENIKLLESTKTETFETLKYKKPSKVKYPLIDNKLIDIKNEIVLELNELLGAYILSQKEQLLELLKGNPIESKVTFKGNQNQLIELFKRLKYNKMIHNSKREISNWLVSNFDYYKNNELKGLNSESVYEGLSKEDFDVSYKNRICISDKFPVITYERRIER